MHTLAPQSDELLDAELNERLHLRFDLARLELEKARLAQRRKDTPAARLRVAQCMHTVDRVLDAWNVVVRAAR